MSKKVLALVTAALTVLAVLVAGCGSSDGSDGSSIKIFAAASLQGVFDDLSKQFTEAHSEYSVAPIVYDGSQALATQIVEGADVDVVAFANQSSLKPVTDKGVTDAGTIFATNTLQIAVAPGNPKHINTLADLAKPGITTVLCAPQVPCGKALHTLLDDQHVTVKPVSEETNVTSVVTRVKAGEADAGLIYKTDVAAAGDALTGITPAGADAVVNRYPIAVTKNSASPEAAKAFVDFVLSADGRKVLERYGFGAP